MLQNVHREVKTMEHRDLFSQKEHFQYCVILPLNHERTESFVMCDNMGESEITSALPV